MHPLEFIEKNIRTHLLNEGYSQSVAQGGGQMLLSTSTAGHLSRR